MFYLQLFKQSHVDLQEAIAAEAFYNIDMCIQKGDLETGFAESDHVLEGEIRTGGQVTKFSFKVCNNVD